MQGAATIGLELADTAASFDAVLIALGGGCGSNVDVDAYHRWVGAAPAHRS